MADGPHDSETSGQPLAGLSVLVARAEGQAEQFRDLLERLGAEVIVQPAIRILPPEDFSPVDEAIARLEKFDWLVFSSANGARFFFDRWESVTKKRLPTPFPRMAAIGPGTAEELMQRGCHVELVPDAYRAEALAEALLAAGAGGKKVLLVRGSRGRETLAERLAAAGVIVEQVVVYRNVDVERPDPAVAARLAAGKLDWIAVTSSSIARSLVKMFGDDLRRARLAGISPVTSGVLVELGYPPAAEAKEYTLPGLVEAICRAIA
jgi:uroporphyrinogen III methyltransferase/synthase